MDLVTLLSTAVEHGPMSGMAILSIAILTIWNVATFYATTKAMREESAARHVENVRRLEIVEADIKTLLSRH